MSALPLSASSDSRKPEKEVGMAKKKNTEKPVVRPKRCGECKKYIRDSKNPGHGFCDNWIGVQLNDYDLCHPNNGIKGTPQEC